MSDNTHVNIHPFSFSPRLAHIWSVQNRHKSYLIIVTTQLYISLWLWWSLGIGLAKSNFQQYPFHTCVHVWRCARVQNIDNNHKNWILCKMVMNQNHTLTVNHMSAITTLQQSAFFPACACATDSNLVNPISTKPLLLFIIVMRASSSRSAPNHSYINWKWLLNRETK